MYIHCILKLRSFCLAGTGPVQTYMYLISGQIKVEKLWMQDKKRGLEAGHYNHVPNQGRHRIIYAFENDMDYCVSQNEVINILTPHCSISKKNLTIPVC